VQYATVISTHAEKSENGTSMGIKTHKPSGGMHPIGIVQTPVLLVILIACAIFITEALVMFLLSILPPHAAWIQAFIDALLLIFLLTPPLYFLMYRPMSRQINELIHTYNHLQSEITERKLVEEALRHSERQLQHLSSQLLSSQEKERKWFSTEMHEGLAQDLAASKLGLQLIKEHLKEDQTTLKNECEENLKLISHVIHNVTSLSEELTPFVLKDFGLHKALQGLINHVALRSGMAVSFQCIDLQHLFPQEAEIAVYRIVEEAVINVEKHARATSLTVVIEQQNGVVSFMVEDNGTGFDTKEVLTKDVSEKGLGLVTMEERIRMLGGSLTVWSQKGRGTRITFILPINQK
jgi:signal transduction histidine kinase